MRSQIFLLWADSREKKLFIHKKKNVIPLIINPSIIGYKTYISTKISDIDSKEEISSIENSNRSFVDVL